MTDPTPEGLQGAMLSESARPVVEFPSVKSLLLELYWGDMRLATATGTLLARDQQSHCSVITNRHVVTGRHQDTGQALDKNGAIPDRITIHFFEPVDHDWRWKAITLPLYRDNGDPYWIEHPTLGEAADIVALNLTWASDVEKFPYYLDTAHDRVGMILRPAEPVSVVGFPFGLSSSDKFPIWATGFLAQELSLVTPQKPVFLIDCRTRAGQSGSPVLAFRTGSYRKIKGTKATTTMSATETAWEFLGIYSGRVNPESDLGRVWHVDALAELLDAAADDDERRRKAAATA
jgi:hypothetical protein